MTIPAEHRAKLAQLREVFMHSAGFQDWVGNWWHGLDVDDRRLLLALCGLDESEEYARRPWGLILQDHRDKLVFELKRIGRLIEGLRWA